MACVGILAQRATHPFLWMSGATLCGGGTSFSLQFCPFIPTASLGAMESSSSPSPPESLPEFVISPSHPVIFVLEWFPDASPFWSAFNACRAEERSVAGPLCRLSEPGNGNGRAPAEWRKPVSLQPELPKPAFQIYAWHLGKAMMQANMKSKYIIIYLCLDLVWGFINDRGFD